jgi:hypothetical protein
MLATRILLETCVYLVGFAIVAFLATKVSRLIYHWNPPEQEGPPDPERALRLLAAGVLVILAAMFFVLSIGERILQRLGSVGELLVAGAVVSTVAGFFERSGRASRFIAGALLVLVLALIAILPGDPPGSCEMACTVVAFIILLASGPTAILGLSLCVYATVLKIRKPS